MKKAFAFILPFVYAMVSMGFVVSVHYCMDKVDTVQLGDAVRDECDKCGMPLLDNKGCCKDEVKVYKLQVDQSFAKAIKVDFSVPLVVSSHSCFLPTPLFNEVKISAPTAHGPPLSKQDTYLHNRVFRL